MCWLIAVVITISALIISLEKLIIGNLGVKYSEGKGGMARFGYTFLNWKKDCSLHCKVVIQKAKA